MKGKLYIIRSYKQQRTADDPQEGAMYFFLSVAFPFGFWRRYDANLRTNLPGCQTKVGKHSLLGARTQKDLWLQSAELMIDDEPPRGLRIPSRL